MMGPMMGGVIHRHGGLGLNAPSGIGDDSDGKSKVAEQHYSLLLNGCPGQ